MKFLITIFALIAACEAYSYCPPCGQCPPQKQCPERSYIPPPQVVVTSTNCEPCNLQCPAPRNLDHEKEKEFTLYTTVTYDDFEVVPKKKPFDFQPKQEVCNVTYRSIPKPVEITRIVEVPIYEPRHKPTKLEQEIQQASYNESHRHVPLSVYFDVLELKQTERPVKFYETRFVENIVEEPVYCYEDDIVEVVREVQVPKYIDIVVYKDRVKEIITEVPVHVDIEVWVDKVVEHRKEIPKVKDVYVQVEEVYTIIRENPMCNVSTDELEMSLNEEVVMPEEIPVLKNLTCEKLMVKLENIPKDLTVEKVNTTVIPKALSPQFVIRNFQVPVPMEKHIHKEFQEKYQVPVYSTRPKVVDIEIGKDVPVYSSIPRPIPVHTDLKWEVPVYNTTSSYKPRSIQLNKVFGKSCTGLECPACKTRCDCSTRGGYIFQKPSQPLYLPSNSK